MKKKTKGNPIVIALFHAGVYVSQKELQESAKRLKRQLDKLVSENARRTMYIEGSPKVIEKLARTQTVRDPFDFQIKTEPFSIAINFARKNGWTVVALDKESLRTISDKADKAFQHSFSGTLRDISNATEVSQYINKNLREKSWARKKFQTGDLIVMHPDHVRGFLIESELKGKNVIWISRPTPLRKSDSFKRLNSAERRRLKRRRDQLRNQRRKTTTKHKAKIK